MTELRDASTVSDLIHDAGQRPTTTLVAAASPLNRRVSFEVDPVTFSTLQSIRTSYRLLLNRRVSATLILRRALEALAAELTVCLSDRKAAQNEIRRWDRARS